VTTPAVLGIDVGTGGTRAGLFDLAGRVIAAGHASHATTFPASGWAEQDPGAVWDAVARAVRACMGSATGVVPLACSLSCTAVTAVTIGRDGAPTGPALLWMDNRAAAEAEEINATRHQALWYTGGRVSPEWMLPKALWIRRHQPERYHGARWLVELHDWILFRLTGQWALSAATASAEWGYDPAAGGWPADLLEQIGLADIRQRWPDKVLAPGQPVGAVTSDAARITGLPAGLPVVQGLMDSFAAALACDVFRPGRVVVSLGSSSAYLAITAEPLSDPRLLGPIRDGLGPGTFLLQGGQTSAASLVRWFCSELGGAADAPALDLEAASVPPGSDGVIAVDTWQGSRTPFRDPSRRGAFVGLNLSHRRAHLYRAVLEAVAYGGRQITDTFLDVGADVRELVVTGGGSQSRLWMQIHADVIGRPLRVLAQRLPVALGAAMCAAAGAGLAPDLRRAAAAMSRIADTIEPDERNRPGYDAGFRAYQDVAGALSRLSRGDHSGAAEPGAGRTGPAGGRSVGLTRQAG
jgi:sugar (pentulose or hexulose) kinase